MRNVHRYLGEAERCEHAAGIARNVALRSVFAEMAVRWRGLAESTPKRVDAHYLSLMEIGSRVSESTLA